MIKKYRAIIATVLALMPCSCSRNATEFPDSEVFSRSEFAAPPMKYRPVPLWFWNNTGISREGVSFQLHQMMEKDGYGGCAILPFGKDFKPDYLSDEYMGLYAHAVSVADSLGAQMSLYDEYGFPSGSMGAINGSGVSRFMNSHPGRTVKRLDKHEIPMEAGKTAELDLGTIEGRLMAVTAYDALSRRVENLKGFISEGILRWTAPLQGRWTVMVFNCVVDGDPNVDYLDADAVRLFVEDTHGLYSAVLGDAVGSTVTSTFFDEPTMYRAEGRMWTDGFNEKFRERYGMDPDAFYPALWYDIGESTPAVRNMMFGLRSELYAEGFMKTVAEWAGAHGIASTGHQDQEEVANTTSVSGDLMLDGKYMTMPGIDKIGGDRPAELYYKVVSSSARNWDKTEVMSETFGAMGNIPVSEMYRTAIEQYTKGITNLIPHAVWYDDSNVTFLPELSWRNPLYNEELPGFNSFLARLRYMLARPGRHVADIAVLYPVQTQYAGHHLDGGLGYYKGGVEVEGTDYPEVSRILTDELGLDFTYIHPEVLDSRCSVKDGRIVMENRIDHEEFRAIVLPGVRTISPSNMKQVMKAWRKGVRVVFTTQMPCQSADIKTDNGKVRKMAEHMLTHSHGKRSASFVAGPDSRSLAGALDGLSPDIAFAGEGEPFNYIHKVISDTDVWFIGNIDGTARTQQISIKGGFARVTVMDPHTGSCSVADTRTEDGRTYLSLSLAPGRSVFLVTDRTVSPECHVRLAPLLALKDTNDVATLSIPIHNDLKIKSIRFELGSTRGLGDLKGISLSGEGECIAGKRLSCSAAKAGFVLPVNLKADSSMTLTVGLSTKDAIDLDNIIEIRKVILHTSEGRTECRIGGSPHIRMGVALRQGGQDGCDNCRIPGLAITKEGTLIAIYDARWGMDRDLQGDIDICCNRSTDGGRTWSPMSKILDMGTWGGLPEKYNGVSDASITVDTATGDIYVAGTWMYGILDESDGHFVEGLDESSTAWNHQWRAHGSQPGYDVKQSSQMLVSKSSDDGLTWSEPVNITRQVKPEDWWLMTTAPGAGITLSDGTIVIPAQGRDPEGMSVSTIITSRDGGRTWSAGSRITDAVPCNECMAVELDDGSIMLNCRSTVNRGRKQGNGRIIATTKDLGQTWTEHATSRKALIEPTCQASIIRVGSRLFFFNPNDTDRRIHHTLKCSTDGGMTWPEELQIELDEGLGAGYSCMIPIDNDTLGILYEGSGANLVFQRVDVSELQ